MEGVKEFINNTCVDLNVELTVRAGAKPGCVAKTEEFCLKRSESLCITYGNNINPFLDGIRACSGDNHQCTETGLFVRECGSAIDKLLNTNNQIHFLIAGQSLVISGYNCR